MHALLINKLTKIYAGGLVALDGIDLTIEQGDFFALLGPNGAGKSTAIGIITSLVNKTAGSIKVFDYDLETHLTAAKACIGLVPQEINFNQFETVLDIVVNQAGFYGIPRRTALSRAQHYLEKLGLWEKRRAVSRTLSGGMKRRLMIARALIHEPQMLILDEPTAGVDIELRRSTWEFLQEINASGRTIILTTHYLEEAEYLCNGIAIIDKGKILQQTTINELLTNLQSETLILDFAEPYKTLPEQPQFSFNALDNKNSVEVSFTKGTTLNELFELLSEHNLHITSMRNKANRLEELFMLLVKGKYQPS